MKEDKETEEGDKQKKNKDLKKEVMWARNKEVPGVATNVSPGLLLPEDVMNYQTRLTPNTTPIIYPLPPRGGGGCDLNSIRLRTYYWN